MYALNGRSTVCLSKPREKAVQFHKTNFIANINLILQTNGFELSGAETREKDERKANIFLSFSL